MQRCIKSAHVGKKIVIVVCKNVNYFFRPEFLFKKAFPFATEFRELFFEHTLKVKTDHFLKNA